MATEAEQFSRNFILGEGLFAARAVAGIAGCLGRKGLLDDDTFELLSGLLGSLTAISAQYPGQGQDDELKRLRELLI